MTTETSLEIVQMVLQNATNPEIVKSLCSEDFRYVSLAYNNPDLAKVMPWAGTHDGFMGLVNTFRGVNRWWSVDAFEPEAAFTDGEHVAIFGSFTLTSRRLKKTYTSPFAVFAKVKNGQIAYMQYMEDTLGTAATFRSEGSWTFQGDPDGADTKV